MQLSHYLPVLRLFIFLTPESFSNECFVKLRMILGLFNKNFSNWHFSINNFDSQLKIMVFSIHNFTVENMISLILGNDLNCSIGI